MAEKVYRIRKLVFRFDKACGEWLCNAANGVTYVICEDCRYSTMWHAYAKGERRLTEHCDSLEAAQAACQSHYEARMREGLEECS